MKFRQRLSNGNLHYWGLITRSDGKEVFINPSEEFDVDPKDVVHQLFTQRFDSDGNELYNGDVVETSYGDKFQIDMFSDQFVELLEDEQVKLVESCAFERIDLPQVSIGYWRS